jgi:hypothetical protein
MLSVPNPHYDHNKLIMMYLINDPVSSGAKAKQPANTPKGFCPKRKWIGGE